MRSLKKRMKQLVLGIVVIMFWLLVWQILAEKIDSKIFLPTPSDTWKALVLLSKRALFWETILGSFIRIVKGFLYAVVCGVVLAVFSAFLKGVRLLLAPLMKLLKAIPVASFIILVLLWVDSENLSVLISFITVLPVIYINVLQAFEQVDKNMLEMAKVFRMPFSRKLRFLYIPCILPGFTAACKIGLGFCFKSGIAAEVIGLPAKSIGGELYKSKLYLMTDELFAWTIVIILLSVFFEGICIYILNKLSSVSNRIHKMAEHKTDAEKQENSNLREKKEKQENSNLGEKKQEDTRLKKENEEQTDSKDFEVCLKNINKSFGKQKVLEQVNICVKSGKPKCIMGASGQGKTTLLRILMGMLKLDEGMVMIPDGKRMAVVFQEDRLIEEATVYANLYAVLGSAFDYKVAEAHLKMTGLEEVGEKVVRELSGGMKRRVAIVRAVLTQPDILILDEAFKGLDSENRDMVIRYIRKFCGEKVILMVSHDELEAEKMGADIMVLERSV